MSQPVQPEAKQRASAGSARDQSQIQNPKPDRKRASRKRGPFSWLLVSGWESMNEPLVNQIKKLPLMGELFYSGRGDLPGSDDSDSDQN